MLFLVDGYNVTKGDPSTQQLALEGQRGALVARLRTRGEQLLGRGRIVVVFDGDPEVGSFGAGGRGAAYPVEVTFSRGATADDTIVARAKGASGEQVCVVSSDREIEARLRVHLGKRLTVKPREAVFESAVGAVRPKPSRTARRSDGDLPSNAAEITRELEREWLTGEE